MLEKNFKTLFNNKYIVAGICATVIIVLMAVFIVYGCALINRDTILMGVSAHGVDLSGLTQQEASEMLSAQVQTDDNCEIAFECDGCSFVLAPSQMDLHLDGEGAAQRAYDIGHKGNVFARIWDAYCAKLAGKNIELSYTLNEDMLAAAIDENLGEKVMPATPYSVTIEKDSILVQNGTDGTGVKLDGVAQQICQDISDGKIDKTITIKILTITAEPIDFEAFCSEYIREARDAEYTTSNGEYVFVPEVLGISFDKEVAREIIADNVFNTEAYRIPAQITMPAVTVEQLQSKFAVDVLGSYTTNYSSSTANRAANVELAAAKINGTVLNPGERFSFNGVVGPRTTAAGFKVAAVYVGDSVADGVGGGICQVSSTLYNAVLLADLKIVNRKNHSMPVTYVPIGRDATVSYGTIDFVFENNKTHPVTICATYQSRNLTVSVKGVDESDGTTIDIVVENAGYTAFATKEITDASLAPGQRKVVKNGTNGSIYNSYKHYKKDGVIIKTEHIAKSTYIPVAKVVAVGPVVPAEPPAEAVDTTQQPTEPAESQQQTVPQTPAVQEMPQAPVQTTPAVQNPDENTATQPPVQQQPQDNEPEADRSDEAQPPVLGNKPEPEATPDGGQTVESQTQQPAVNEAADETSAPNAEAVFD